MVDDVTGARPSALARRRARLLTLERILRRRTPLDLAVTVTLDSTAGGYSTGFDRPCSVTAVTAAWRMDARRVPCGGAAMAETGG
jgi:hypothetical protein